MVRAREFVYVFGIALFALGLRTAYLVEFSGDPEFSAPAVDAGYHDYWARALAFGNWMPPAGLADPLIRSTPYFRPPGYPYFLAAAYKLFGTGYFGPRLVQMLLGVMNCFLGYLVARRLFGSGVGLLLAGFMSFYWSFIYFEMEFLEPVVAVTLALVLIHLLVLWTEAHTLVRVAAAGVVLGLFALVRTNVLLFGVACVPWSWFLSRRQGLGARRWLALMAVFAGSTALVILPVTIRNLRVAGEFVPISSNDGINLFMGNNERANGMVAEEIAGLGPFRNCFDYPALVRKLENRLGQPLRYTEVSAYFRKESWRFITQNPHAVLDLAVKKTLLFWGPLEVGHNREDEVVREHSRILRWLPGGFSLVLTSFVAGLLIFASNRFREHKSGLDTDEPSRRQREAVLLIVLFVFVYFVSHLPFFVSGRYRIPLVPFLLLFGAYGLHHLWARIITAREFRAAVWLIVGALLYVAFSNIRTEYQPAQTRWLLARGIAFAARENWDQAATTFKKAFELDHTYAESSFLAGIALAKQNRMGEAVEYLVRSVQLQPGNPDMHSTLGAVYGMKGELDSAEVEIQKALRIDPSHREALQNQSYVRERRRQGGR